MTNIIPPAKNNSLLFVSLFSNAGVFLGHIPPPLGISVGFLLLSGGGLRFSDCVFAEFHTAMVGRVQGVVKFGRNFLCDAIQCQAAGRGELDDLAADRRWQFRPAIDDNPRQRTRSQTNRPNC